jgi:hypothetical protein
MTDGTDSTVELRRPRPGTGLTVPVFLSLLAAVGVLLVVLDDRSPVRGIVVGVFVLVGPGLAVLDPCRLLRGWLAAAMVVAISLSTTTCLVLVQLYTGTWSPLLGLALLMMVILGVELIELARRLRRTSSGAR